ncbi:YciI family protein [Actinoplanes sp. NPDC049599]|uniref:YciI family protein n=1 Tax=Actinoplanes sp. NPDC049599 TaxID=3363903 RepID=UPI0037BD8FD9
MKFMLLIYSSTGAGDATAWLEQNQRSKGRAALVDELFDSGEYIDGNLLASLDRSRTVRVENARTATDGPYLEAEAYLAGYDVVDCEDLHRAETIAARLSEATSCAVEIRPVMHFGTDLVTGT